MLLWCRYKQGAIFKRIFTTLVHSKTQFVISLQKHPINKASSFKIKLHPEDKLEAHLDKHVVSYNKNVDVSQPSGKLAALNAPSHSLLN